MYLSHSDNNTISVIDSIKDQIILKDLTVGNNPTNIDFDPKNNKVFVINEDSNTVSVIDGNINKVIKTMEIGNKPYDVDFNPDINSLYVTNSYDDTINIIKL